MIRVATPRRRNLNDTTEHQIANLEEATPPNGPGAGEELAQSEVTEHQAASDRKRKRLQWIPGLTSSWYRPRRRSIRRRAVETPAPAKDPGLDEQQVQTGRDAGALGPAEPGPSDGRVDSEECQEERQPAEATTERKRISWRVALVYIALPVLAMLLAGGAGYMKWRVSIDHETDTARTESIQAATDITVKMLSYKPDSVQNDLDSARDKMTGSFRDSYTHLIQDVVIPGAKQKRISATATVPAAASVSASPNHAVVLAFVNQTIIFGDEAPSSMASSVRVVLDKVGNRWLISDFSPV